MGEENEEKDASIVKKDFAQEYNEAVKRILDEIDECKKQMLMQPSVIINYNERLHALFLKLYQKMNKDERGMQLKIRRIISKIKLFYPKRFVEEGEIITKKIMHRKDFIRLKSVLERREIELNLVLERVGLTAPETKKGRRVR